MVYSSIFIMENKLRNVTVLMSYIMTLRTQILSVAINTNVKTRNMCIAVIILIGHIVNIKHV